MSLWVRSREDTARNRLLEAIASVSGRNVVSGGVLSGDVGGGARIKPGRSASFHGVLVNSAHQASIAAQDRDRWLPLFWALDNFKNFQVRNRTEANNWAMPPIPDEPIAWGPLGPPVPRGHGQLG